MAYAATAEDFASAATSAPRLLALQRALVWLVGASGAIVFIEPSPYELMTLTAAVIFVATGLRLRLVFMPLLLLLFLRQCRLFHRRHSRSWTSPRSPTGSRHPGTWRSR